MRSHDTEAGPLFLYLPYQAVHAPLEAPRDEFRKIKKRWRNSARDIYRAMLSRLDLGVKQVVTELKRQKMWNNTILVFTTDNGGAVSQAGSNHPLRQDSSSNLTPIEIQVQSCLNFYLEYSHLRVTLLATFSLRGTKGTLFEGGTHGVGFVAGGAVNRARKVERSLFHISDWYPTLITAAGGKHLLQKDLDGINQWQVINKGVKSNRSEMVYNLKMSPPSGAIRVGSYKLMFARNFTKDNWYDIDSVSLPISRSPRAVGKLNKQKKREARARGNRRNRKIKKGNKDGLLRYTKHIVQLEGDAAEILGFKNKTNKKKEKEKEDKYIEKLMSENRYQEIFDKKWPTFKKHLFNIDDDPEERNDLLKTHPKILEKLRKRVRELYSSFVPSDFPADDHKGSPKHFGGVWSPGWC